MMFSDKLFKVEVVLGLLLLICCCLCWCRPSPVSYRENLDGTTPKTYRDKFTLQKEDKEDNSITATKSLNYNKFLRSKFKLQNRPNEEQVDQQLDKSLDKVKSVMPGEKTMKESDEDDDDDDDGGEYEGFDYDDQNKKNKDPVLPQQDSRKVFPSPEESNDSSQYKKKDEQCKVQDSVPMMIIHEVDMVAMQIPINDSQKAQKEWSQWSPCSKPCGNGVQSRWRLKPGHQDKEQQLRPCNLGGCDSRNV